mgnify:CR=1 FL=1
MCSRRPDRAAIVYRDKLLAARDELVADIEAIPAAARELSDHEIEKLDRKTRFLVRAYPILSRIRALDVAVVISGDHNDPESWWDWSNKEKQGEYTKRFKRKLAVERTEKTDPLALMVVAAFGFIPAVLGAALQEIVDLLTILGALRALSGGRGAGRGGRGTTRAISSPRSSPSAPASLPANAARDGDR